MTSAFGSATAAPKAIPPAPGIAVVNNCGNSLLTATGVTGTMLWSTNETTSAITVTTAGTYTVTQTVNLMRQHTWNYHCVPATFFKCTGAGGKCCKQLRQLATDSNGRYPVQHSYGALERQHQVLR